MPSYLSTSTTSPVPSQQGPSSNIAIGLGAGIGAGLGLIALAIVFFAYRKYRFRAKISHQEPVSDILYDTKFASQTPQRSRNFDQDVIPTELNSTQIEEMSTEPKERIAFKIVEPQELPANPKG